MRPIYLDHHATTPCDPRVVALMLPFFTEHFGNAASTTHTFGTAARDAVERARGEVALLVGGRPSEIVFTSGATEALNLAIKGIAAAAPRTRRRLLLSAVEHEAVRASVAAAARDGFEVVALPVDHEGRVAPDDLAADLARHGNETALVAVMLANNEVGTIQPVAALAALAAAHGVPFVCDAVQGIGKTVAAPAALEGMTAIAISAHKFNGPKGVGALWLRGRPPLGLAPIMHGGSQERGLRAGTVAVPLVVGLGEAARLLRAEGADRVARMESLRDALWRGLSDGLGDGVSRNTPSAGALANNLNVSFDGVESRALMARLPTLAFSAGSACRSEGGAPSHVLTAMGLTPRQSLSAARFGLGPSTTADDIADATQALVEAVRVMRGAART